MPRKLPKIVQVVPKSQTGLSGIFTCISSTEVLIQSAFWVQAFAPSLSKWSKAKFIISLSPHSSKVKNLPSSFLPFHQHYSQQPLFSLVYPLVPGLHFITFGHNSCEAASPGHCWMPGCRLIHGRMAAFAPPPPLFCERLVLSPWDVQFLECVCLWFLPSIFLPYLS